MVRAMERLLLLQQVAPEPILIPGTPLRCKPRLRQQDCVPAPMFARLRKLRAHLQDLSWCPMEISAQETLVLRLRMLTLHRQTQGQENTGWQAARRFPPGMAE